MAVMYFLMAISIRLKTIYERVENNHLNLEGSFARLNDDLDNLNDN